MRTALAILALAFIVGCASFQNTASKTLTSIALTVDAAMKGWATHVVKDNVPDSQQTVVKSAYAQYQASMAVAVSAYAAVANGGDKTAWDKALAALQASQGGLIQVIQSFGGAK